MAPKWFDHWTTLAGPLQAKGNINIYVLGGGGKYEFLPVCLFIVQTVEDSRRRSPFQFTPPVSVDVAAVEAATQTSIQLNSTQRATTDAGD